MLVTAIPILMIRLAYEYTWPIPLAASAIIMTWIATFTRLSAGKSLMERYGGSARRWPCCTTQCYQKRQYIDISINWIRSQTRVIPFALSMPLIIPLNNNHSLSKCLSCITEWFCFHLSFWQFLGFPSMTSIQEDASLLNNLSYCILSNWFKLHFCFTTKFVVHWSTSVIFKLRQVQLDKTSFMIVCFVIYRPYYNTTYLALAQYKNLIILPSKKFLACTAAFFLLLVCC